MRWEVKGADRRTGEDRQIFVEANDEAQATRRAGRQGLLVESARPLDSNDSMAGGSPQVVQAAVTPPPQLPYAQPVYIMQQAAPQQLWNPGVAAMLSFLIPGAGQMYKGQVLNGLVWFAMVVVGYFLCFPGIILHLLCVGGAAMGDSMKRESNLVGNVVAACLGAVVLLGVVVYKYAPKPTTPVATSPSTQPASMPAEPGQVEPQSGGIAEVSVVENGVPIKEESFRKIKTSELENQFRKAVADQTLYAVNFETGTIRMEAVKWDTFTADDKRFLVKLMIEYRRRRGDAMPSARVVSVSAQDVYALGDSSGVKIFR
ncbi:MAG: hypothetical protein IT447_16705 [Phycisphaerales bacterium]|nr:hypothetical protein [Phycisphaerales bacterium]